MNSANHDSDVDRARRSRPPVAMWVSLGAAVLAITIGAAWLLRGQTSDPPPLPVAPSKSVPTLPQLDWTDADPAVEKAVKAQLELVRQQMDSPNAWGKLGMLLFAHGFKKDSADSFEIT